MFTIEETITYNADRDINASANRTHLTDKKMYVVNEVNPDGKHISVASDDGHPVWWIRIEACEKKIRRMLPDWF
jgi:hypothetical protein